MTYRVEFDGALQLLSVTSVRQDAGVTADLGALPEVVASNGLGT